MLDIAIEASRFCNLLASIFLVFLAVLFYLVFLWMSNYYRRTNISFSRRKIIHHFYLFLTCSTLAVTLSFLFFSPLHFYGGGAVCLVCAYLFYLGFTNFFPYVIISEELPRWHLVIVMLVTITSLGYTAFAALVHANILVESNQVYVLTQALETHSQCLSEERAEKDIQLPTPLEGGNLALTMATPPERTGSMRGVLNWAIQDVTQAQVEKTIKAPTTPELKELEQKVWNAVTTHESADVWHPDEFQVKMAGNAMVLKNVQVESAGEIKNPMVLCYDTSKVAAMAGENAVPGLGNKIITKTVVETMVNHDVGCVCFHRTPAGDFTFISRDAKALFHPLEQDSPRSPPSHDLQSARLSEKNIT